MPVKEETMDANTGRQNARNLQMTQSSRRREGERISNDNIQLTRHKSDTKNEQTSASFGVWGPVLKSRRDFVDMHLF